MVSDAPDRWERAEKPCEAYGRYRTSGGHGTRGIEPAPEGIAPIPARTVADEVGVGCG